VAADLPAAAPVSVEAALTVVDSTVVGSTGAGFMVASMGATLPAAVFVAIVASAAIGFAIVTSTTSFSSEIFGTRSFTIRIHITVTILTDIIPMVMDTILTINLFTRAERDIPILWSIRSSSAWLVPAYYRGVIDGVSGNATRRAIRDYQRAHSLPADGQIRGRLLTSMGLG